MAEADFSSFGADKFRPAWTAGIHAGYRFTPVWSLELFASWGRRSLLRRVVATNATISLVPTTTDTATPFRKVWGAGTTTI